MRTRFILLYILSCLLFFSCGKEEPVDIPSETRRTLFMYCPWSTNLTDYIDKNLTDMETAIVRRGGLDGERVFVFRSSSASQAELFEIVCENGGCRRRVIQEYTDPTLTTREWLAELFTTVKTLSPTGSYAMTVSCHGMGWLPVEQATGVRTQTARRDTFRYHWEYPESLPTRFFGGLTAEYQTEISTLADALSDAGMNMDYILFDDCYMSSVEVAYELRHATRYLIASPTEIMAEGMPYSEIGDLLLAENPDYGAVCEEFHRFYSSYRYPYGTLAVTDCSRMEELAALMKGINARYSMDVSSADRLQRMDGYAPAIFYDFGDYVTTLCGGDSESVRRFEELMREVVPCKVHTEEYYSASRGACPIDTFSGLTTSEPSYSTKAESYENTPWYRDTH